LHASELLAIFQLLFNLIFMDFKEDFLQLVWKYQYFDRKNLTTTDGQALEILQAGHSNALEGPDFRNASVVIGGHLSRPCGSASTGFGMEAARSRC
jgi:hypothetical protein